MVVRGRIENGVVILADGVRLPEGQAVTVVAEVSEQVVRDHAGTNLKARSLARQTAGMIPWSGDVETLELLATDPEFGIAESP